MRTRAATLLLFAVVAAVRAQEPSTGRLSFDATKPDGTPRKLMDVSRLAALGWRSAIGLEDGLRDTYRWFVEHKGRWRA